MPRTNVVGATAADLVKVLGMLGSPHVGERAAAGLQADQLVKQLGLRWPNIIAVEGVMRDALDTFQAACRGADTKRAAAGDDPGLARLRRLMSADILIERTYAELNRREGTAASTVEALMFGLRERGTPALTEPDTRRRLSSLDAQQLRAVCTRLRNLKSEIAGAWTPEEVEALAVVWRNLK
jgi:hypothetical protein